MEQIELAFTNPGGKVKVKFPLTANNCDSVKVISARSGLFNVMVRPMLDSGADVTILNAEMLGRAATLSCTQLTLTSPAASWLSRVSVTMSPVVMLA